MILICLKSSQKWKQIIIIIIKIVSPSRSLISWCLSQSHNVCMCHINLVMIGLVRLLPGALSKYTTRKTFRKAYSQRLFFVLWVCGFVLLKLLSELHYTKESKSSNCLTVIPHLCNGFREGCAANTEQRTVAAHSQIKAGSCTRGQGTYLHAHLVFCAVLT